MLLVLAIAAAVFGVLTVVSGSRALFGSEAARAAAGAAVPFVLWFNFLAGFAYLVAATGIALGRSWARPLAVALAAATVAIFVLFGVAIAAGVPYEMRTVGAMVLRSAFWISVALVLIRRRVLPSQL